MPHPTTGYLATQVQYQFFAPTGGGFQITGFDCNNPDIDMLLGYVEDALESLKAAYEAGENAIAYVNRSYLASRTDENFIL